jgi:hypothetical protein
MDTKRVYVRSEDVVAREIEDEFLLVPIASGIGDMEDALYTLNETGKEIWQRLDGQKTLEDLVAELSEEYDADPDEIRQDICGLVGELEKLNMVEALR